MNIGVCLLLKTCKPLLYICESMWSYKYIEWIHKYLLWSTLSLWGEFFTYLDLDTQVSSADGLQVLVQLFKNCILTRL